MDRKNFSNIGDEIKDIVQNAVNTRDFHQLNRDITDTVYSALDELKHSIGYNRNNWQNHDYNQHDWNHQNQNQHNWDNPHKNNSNKNYQNNGYDYTSNNANWNQPFWDKQTWNKEHRRSTPKTNTSTRRNHEDKTVPKHTQYTVPVGRVAGILCTVFGSIGIVLLGIGSIVLGILGSIFQMTLYYIIVAGLAPLLLASIVLSIRGSSIRKRLKRFQQYIGLLRNRNYTTVKELSKGTGLSDKFIVKDLRQMISIGMFPEGHIDDMKTCFMLNNESYEQYLNLQESMKTQKADAQKQAEQTKANATNAKKAESQNPELSKAIEEGRSYVRQIREANDAIPGEEISRKLYRLEDVTSKIFDYVALHPEQLSDIQKFLDYYLPTTSKLLNAYREFDRQPVQGENITSAKKEIESTLDTINLAFENLLDSLFQDAAMDISTDISVLQTMLKQEGLAEKDF